MGIIGYIICCLWAPLYSTRSIKDSEYNRSTFWGISLASRGRWLGWGGSTSPLPSLLQIHPRSQRMSQSMWSGCSLGIVALLLYSLLVLSCSQLLRTMGGLISLITLKTSQPRILGSKIAESNLCPFRPPIPTLSLGLCTWCLTPHQLKCKIQCTRPCHALTGSCGALLWN